jgi:putative two-component system response regulator
VLTAQADQETRVRALQAGARDFLTKPFNIPEVTVRIQNMLESCLLYHQVLHHTEMLEETVARRTADLRSAQFEIVQRLALTAERRDPETGAHIMRMSRACGMVAAAGGWPSHEVELMLHASPLHDVGKVGIVDAVLLKPGPLTSVEWVVMRSHTTIGAELLSGGTSQLMQTARTIALSHHEWWDGSGYPEGLAGEAIPLTARVCAVCDVFDAMTNDRVYHAARPVEEVVDYIHSARGTHFDPNIVAWFDKALPEILSAGKLANSR